MPSKFRINQLYEKNEDFKRYVDRYSTKHGIDPYDALKHYMIKDVAQYYITQCSKTPTEPAVPHIDISEDKSC